MGIPLSTFKYLEREKKGEKSLLFFSVLSPVMNEAKTFRLITYSVTIWTSYNVILNSKYFEIGILFQ